MSWSCLLGGRFLVTKKALYVVYMGVVPTELCFPSYCIHTPTRSIAVVIVLALNEGTCNLLVVSSIGTILIGVSALNQITT